MTIQEAQAKLDALLAEQVELQSSEVTLEAELNKCRKRLSALRSGWRALGEIELARREVRDSAFPILWEPAKDSFCRAQRIVAVSDKTITVREDGMDDDDVRKYSRATGRPPNSKYGNKIDVEKAIAIWTAHQSKTPTA